MESRYRPAYTGIFMQTNQRAALKKVPLFLCCDWLSTLGHGAVLNEAKPTNQRAALERCWSSESQKMTEK